MKSSDEQPWKAALNRCPPMSRLSPEERANVEAQLDELTATYNQLCESSTQQLQQLEQQLAKEEERKVYFQERCAAMHTRHCRFINTLVFRSIWNKYGIFFFFFELIYKMLLLKCISLQVERDTVSGPARVCVAQHVVFTVCAFHHQHHHYWRLILTWFWLTNVKAPFQMWI